MSSPTSLDGEVERSDAAPPVWTYDKAHNVLRLVSSGTDGASNFQIQLRCPDAPTNVPIRMTLCRARGDADNERANEGNSSSDAESRAQSSVAWLAIAIDHAPPPLLPHAIPTVTGFAAFVPPAAVDGLLGSIAGYTAVERLLNEGRLPVLVHLTHEHLQPQPQHFTTPRLISSLIAPSIRTLMLDPLAFSKNATTSTYEEELVRFMATRASLASSDREGVDSSFEKVGVRALEAKPSGKEMMVEGSAPGKEDDRPGAALVSPSSSRGPALLDRQAPGEEFATMPERATTSRDSGSGSVLEDGGGDSPDDDGRGTSEALSNPSARDASQAREGDGRGVGGRVDSVAEDSELKVQTGGPARHDNEERGDGDGGSDGSGGDGSSASQAGGPEAAPSLGLLLPSTVLVWERPVRSNRTSTASLAKRTSTSRMQLAAWQSQPDVELLRELAPTTQGDSQAGGGRGESAGEGHGTGSQPPPSAQVPSSATSVACASPLQALRGTSTGAETETTRRPQGHQGDDEDESPSPLPLPRMGGGEMDEYPLSGEDSQPFAGGPGGDGEPRGSNTLLSVDVNNLGVAESAALDDVNEEDPSSAALNRLLERLDETDWERGGDFGFGVGGTSLAGRREPSSGADLPTGIVGCKKGLRRGTEQKPEGASPAAGSAKQEQRGSQPMEPQAEDAKAVGGRSHAFSRVERSCSGSRRGGSDRSRAGSIGGAEAATAPGSTPAGSGPNKSRKGLVFDGFSLVSEPWCCYYLRTQSCNFSPHVGFHRQTRQPYDPHSPTPGAAEGVCMFGRSCAFHADAAYNVIVDAARAGVIPPPAPIDAASPSAPLSAVLDSLIRALTRIEERRCRVTTTRTPQPLLSVVRAAHSSSADAHIDARPAALKTVGSTRATLLVREVMGTRSFGGALRAAVVPPVAPDSPSEAVVSVSDIVAGAGAEGDEPKALSDQGVSMPRGSGGVSGGREGRQTFSQGGAGEQGDWDSVASHSSGRAFSGGARSSHSHTARPPSFVPVGGVSRDGGFSGGGDAGGQGRSMVSGGRFTSQPAAGAHGRQISNENVAMRQHRNTLRGGGGSGGGGFGGKSPHEGDTRGGHRFGGGDTASMHHPGGVQDFGAHPGAVQAATQLQQQLQQMGGGPQVPYRQPTPMELAAALNLLSQAQSGNLSAHLKQLQQIQQQQPMNQQQQTSMQQPQQPRYNGGYGDRDRGGDGPNGAVSPFAPLAQLGSGVPSQRPAAFVSSAARRTRGGGRRSGHVSGGNGGGPGR